MSTRRAFLKAVTSVAASASAGGLPGALAQTSKPAAERLGLKGYDPVAYFTLGTPTPGIAGLEYVWDDVRYRFANAQHLALFKGNPEKYAPQFGGSCAMNLANGNRREANPTIWVISSGKLYVFAGQTGQERFRHEPEASAMKAAANWQTLKDKPSQ